ncbi:MAG: BatA domain-containing protein [Acidobacteriota bacterium]
MRAVWLLPGAWWLGLLVAVPIAAHLLARPRRAPLRFPSLRFLSTAAAPARRRWQVREPGLLAVRVALVLAAAAAVAAPIVVTAARQAGWDARVARATVVVPALDGRGDGANAAVAAPEGVARAFVTDDLSQGLADASAWLEAQGPSRRELVVAGPLSRHTAAVIAASAVPRDIGLSFRRAGALPARTRERERVELRSGALWRIRESLVIGEADTSLQELSRSPEAGHVVSVQATPEARPAADAALRAVLRRGVVVAAPSGAPLSAPWSGRVEELAAWIDAHSTGPAHAGSAAPGRLEPVPLSDADVQAMTRPAAPRGPAAPIDAGDRRAVWLIVLVLLGLETWLRRGPA